MLDGTPQTAQDAQLFVTMDRPHMATAHYTAAGDFNGDGKIDEADLRMIAASFGARSGERNYIPQMDFDNDGAITMKDIATQARELAV